MALSISYKLDRVFDDFLDKIYTVEIYEWEGDHDSFRALVTKHFGSDIEDAYQNWYEDNE